MRLPLTFIALLLATSAADAHDWYVGTNDPVTGGSCCTTSASAKWGDCAQLIIEPGVLEAVDGGYRIRLTVEQARRLNPLRKDPVDTFVPEERVQESEDGNWHMCIPQHSSVTPNDFYCFWRPGAF